MHLSGTAADRMGTSPHGAFGLFVGVTTLAARHAGRHVRNHSSLDLSPVPAAGPPLQLVISDGLNATAPLTFTAANCASLALGHGGRAEPPHHRAPGRSPCRAGVVRARDGPDPGRRASEIRFSPLHDDEIWVGLPDGTVVMTETDGVRWTDVTDPAMRLMDRPVEAIACHPVDRRTIYVGLAGDGAASGDHGFLFKTTTAAPPWQQIGHQVVAGVNTGIVSDGRPLGISAIEIDPAEPAVVYVGTEAGVFRSPDGGACLGPVRGGPPTRRWSTSPSSPCRRPCGRRLWTRAACTSDVVDAAAPEDARLVIRATALDDGTRPSRAAPSFHTSAPAPLLLESPDIKHVARRPAIGTDEHVDGVAFDLLVPHDDIVAGATSEVIVQVGQPRRAGGAARVAPAARGPSPGRRAVGAGRRWRPAVAGRLLDPAHGRSAGRSGRGVDGAR